MLNFWPFKKRLSRDIAARQDLDRMVYHAMMRGEGGEVHRAGRGYQSLTQQQQPTAYYPQPQPVVSEVILDATAN